MVFLDLIRPAGLTDRQWFQMKLRALSAAMNATPVRTGRLKNGWTIKGDRIENPVEYAQYVNDGTPRMAPRSMTGAALKVLGGR